MNPAVIDFINTSRDRYLEELTQYLAIPSVSALAEHAGGHAPLRRLDCRSPAGRSASRTCGSSTPRATRSSTATG